MSTASRAGRRATACCAAPIRGRTDAAPGVEHDGHIDVRKPAGHVRRLRRLGTASYPSATSTATASTTCSPRGRPRPISISDLRAASRARRTCASWARPDGRSDPRGSVTSTATARPTSRSARPRGARRSALRTAARCSCSTDAARAQWPASIGLAARRDHVRGEPSCFVSDDGTADGPTGSQDSGSRSRGRRLQRRQAPGPRVAHPARGTALGFLGAST
jgi:hypothetical protein